MRILVRINPLLRRIGAKKHPHPSDTSRPALESRQLSTSSAPSIPWGNGHSLGLVASPASRHSAMTAHTHRPAFADESETICSIPHASRALISLAQATSYRSLARARYGDGNRKARGNPSFATPPV